MSEFDDLFDDEIKEETEEKPPKTEVKPRIKTTKTTIKKPKKKTLELTEEEINKTITTINHKITITRLMTCYEILTGVSIRENKNITIDEIITELSYILLNNKLKNIEINKDDVITILNNKLKELEE